MKKSNAQKVKKQIADPVPGCNLTSFAVTCIEAVLKMAEGDPSDVQRIVRILNGSKSVGRLTAGERRYCELEGIDPLDYAARKM